MLFAHSVLTPLPPLPLLTSVKSNSASSGLLFLSCPPFIALKIVHINKSLQHFTIFLCGTKKNSKWVRLHLCSSEIPTHISGSTGGIGGRTLQEMKVMSMCFSFYNIKTIKTIVMYRVSIISLCSYFLFQSTPGALLL